MQPEQQRRGFTLIEVLVVVIIIGVLMAILIPVISKVRVAARTANTESFISQLSRAIEAYHADFRAYPGPLSNVEVWNGNAPSNAIAIANVPASEGFAITQGTTFSQKITRQLV